MHGLSALFLGLGFGTWLLQAKHAAARRTLVLPRHYGSIAGALWLAADPDVRAALDRAQERGVDTMKKKDAAAALAACRFSLDESGIAVTTVAVEAEKGADDAEDVSRVRRWLRRVRRRSWGRKGSVASSAGSDAATMV